MRDYQSLQYNIEKDYRTWSSVYCPYLQEHVYFNIKGLRHIKFKSWRKARLLEDRRVRLRYLHLAPTIVRKSHTLQEYKTSTNTPATLYYAFVAILENVRLKIIVKQEPGKKPYFWSIIPFWKTMKDNENMQTKKIFHEGDLENQ